MTNATEIKIEVGAVFGYRKVVEVTSRNVSYVNLNGRKNAAGRKVASALPVHTLTRGEFRTLIGA
jgi:hypothetical protein